MDLESGDALSTSSSNISMNDFLEFLKITCQVNDSIGNVSRAPGSEIDYNKLAHNKIVNGLLGPQFKQSMPEAVDGDPKTGDKRNDKGRKRSTTSLGSKTSKNKIENFAEKGIHPVLSFKLDEVINEGILDSVLPFICPPSSNNCSEGSLVSIKSNKIKTRDVSPNMNLKPPPVQDMEKKDIVHEIVPYVSRSPRFSEGAVRVKEGRLSRRKSVAHTSHLPSDEKKFEADVVIHVCDEVKNMSKDFSCPQSLLVSKMGYFADVTAGQKLEDMDISVHCDIQIFEWLMRWVKKDANQSDSWPQLDATNVVPILVSASFLQVEIKSKAQVVVRSTRCNKANMYTGCFRNKCTAIYDFVDFDKLIIKLYGRGGEFVTLSEITGLTTFSEEHPVTS